MDWRSVLVSGSTASMVVRTIRLCCCAIFDGLEFTTLYPAFRDDLECAMIVFRLNGGMET